MNTANQMAEEIYDLHCDIDRLENEKKHWHTEFINEQEYAHAMEERSEKAESNNARLRELVRIIAFCAYADGSDCDKCAMNGAEMRFKIDETAACDGMRNRLRELGIEVDE